MSAPAIAYAHPTLVHCGLALVSIRANATGSTFDGAIVGPSIKAETRAGGPLSSQSGTTNALDGPRHSFL